jgi:hypothetical protein
MSYGERLTAKLNKRFEIDETTVSRWLRKVTCPAHWLA